MTKRKTKKAAAALGMILDKLDGKSGGKSPERVYFDYDPAQFIRQILDNDAETIAAYILRNAGTDGLPKEYHEAIEKHRRPGYTPPKGLSSEEALEIAREMKKAIEEAFQERLKKILPGEYPLSTQVIKQTLNPLPGLKNQSYECKDDHKLTAAHFKLEHAFLCLLEETSEEKNPESENYFSGNLEAETLTIKNQEGGEVIETKQALTQIRPRDIFRAYYGKKKVSGAERKNVWRAIDEYRELNFNWVLSGTLEDGRVLRAEITRPRVEVELISITDPATAEKIAAGDTKAREEEQLIRLKFHPAFLSFRLDGGKYSKVPKNLNTILETAAGGARKVTAAHFRFFHYLNSLRSARRTIPGEEIIQTEIKRQGLIEKLGLSHFWESRNGHKGEAALKKVIEDIKETGLIQGYKIRPGNDDQVFVFSVFSAPAWLETQKGGRTLRKGG